MRVIPVLVRAATRLLLATVLCVGIALGGPVGSALLPNASAAEAGVNLNSIEPSGLAQATALGAHWVRVFAPWPDLEPSPGVHSAYWLGEYDRLFDSLPTGTHAIVDFVDTPSWESGSAASNAPPSNPADYANILHFLAGQWSGHVAAYEIWNEEDQPLWWAGAPDPAAYTRLLQAAYPAVKSADPAAKVVLGGLTGNDYNFLEGVYQAGGKGYFDAVGVHTDTACDVNSPFTFLRDNDGQINEDSFIGYREVHATEIANGDDDADLDDRDELAHDLRGVHRRRVRGAEAGGCQRRTAGHLPRLRPITASPRRPTCSSACGTRSTTKARSCPVSSARTTRTSPHTRRCAATSSAATT